MPTHGTPWIVVPAPKPAARLRLFSLPYGGGGPSAFSAWPLALPPDIELCAVQMPGREARVHEAPITRWDEAVARVVEALGSWMDRPFALFGHSLGAMLAFEIARSLRGVRQAALIHLFASGRRAPHLPRDRPPTFDLPEPEFVQELRRLAGTPEEILQSAEMMEIYVPLLRADLRMAETYEYREGAPLGVPISAYGASEDIDVSAAALKAWCRETIAPFRQVMFEGDHFFLHTHRPAVVAQLTRDLRETLGR